MRLQQLDMDKKYLVIVQETDGYTIADNARDIEDRVADKLRILGMPRDNFSVLVGAGFDLMFVEANGHE